MESLQIFAADPLVAKPGAKFNYSTYGYTLLGCVLEGAALEKYVDFVKKNVFQPAGMGQTQADDFFAVIPHRTRWYHKDKSGLVRNAGVLDSSYKIPGGGYVTTAEDLMRFAQALMDGKILKPDTLAQMWSPTKLTGGKMSNYGLGFLALMIGGEKYVFHNGSQQGTSTAMAIIPGRHFAVAALANMDGVDPFEVVRGILKVFDMPFPKPD